MPITTLNITKPFAENGDRNQIPAFSQNEQVSYDEGWTEAYSRLTSDLFFNREDINGILYSLSIACIINDENMQVVKTDCETEAQNIKDALDAAKTALQNSIDLKDAQINLNKDAIAVNANDIARLLTKITDIENQINGGNLDNNALDAIKQAVALLQTEVQNLTQCCNDVNATLILKADAANVYTKTEADDKFAEKASIAGAFIYKQEVETIADLPPNADNGSVYLVKRVEYTDDEGNIHFNEVMYLKGNNGYTPLSTSMLQINSDNFAKLDRQNVFAMTNKITTPNAVDDNDIVTLGEVKAKILESENNLQQSNTQFATDINQLRQDLTREVTDRQAEDDKLDLKVRQNIINIGTNLGSINALDARVLRLEQGGGGGGTLTPDQLANLAQLNQANTFTKENTFNMGVQIPTAPKDDDSATNKRYVTNQMEAQLQLVNEILKDYVKLSSVKEVDYYNQLPQNATIGEVYKVVIGDINYKAGYYLWNGNVWHFVGNSVQDIESAGFAMLRSANTFTNVNTFQDDVLLEGGNPKTQDSAVNKRYLDSRLSNHEQDADLKYAQKAQPNNFTALNTFAVTPQITGTITQNTDATTKQYVDNAIVNAINGQVPIDLSSYAQVNQINNWTAQQNFVGEVMLQFGQPTSLESAVNRGWVETYVANELANNVPQIDTSDLASLTKDNTFTGTNHFTLSNTETFDLMSDNGKTLVTANNINMQVDFPILIKNPKTEAQKDQIADNELVTKAQVAFLAGGGGSGGAFDTTANYTWMGNNIFNGKLESGTTATSIDDLTDTEVPTKKLVVEKIESLRIVSQDIPSGDYPAGTIWIKTSYAQDPNDYTIFTDKPSLFICLGNSEWWNIHKEELL